MIPRDVAQMVIKSLDGEHSSHLSADVEAKPGPMGNQVKISLYYGDEGQLGDHFIATIEKVSP